MTMKNNNNELMLYESYSIGFLYRILPSFTCFLLFCDLGQSVLDFLPKTLLKEEEFSLRRLSSDSRTVGNVFVKYCLLLLG